MEITVQKGQMEKGIKAIKPVVGGYLALGDDILVSAGDSCVSVRTRELSTRARVDIPGEGSNFRVVLSASAALRALKALSGKPSHPVRISYAGGDECSIGTLDGASTVGVRAWDLDLYPDPSDPFVPEVVPTDRVSGCVTGIGAAIESVVSAMSADSTRLHLSSMYLAVSDGVATLACTDGHRLHVAMCGCDMAATRDCLIPACAVAAIRALLKVSDGATLSVVGADAESWTLETDMGAVTWKPVDATFPPYRKVIPREHDIEVRIDKKDLVDVMKSARGFKSTTLEFHPDGIRVTASDIDTGATLDTAVYGTVERRDGERPSGRIGFNPRYLLDAAAAFPDDTVVLRCGGQLDAATVGDPLDGSGAVVMPVRI